VFSEDGNRFVKQTYAVATSAARL